MTPNQPAEIWPLVLFAALVLFLIVAMLFVGWLLGQRKRVDATNDPYESGIVSVGSAQLKISVEFYLVAMFFVIFDLEAIFIFAYAVAFFELGWQGYISMKLLNVLRLSQLGRKYPIRRELVSFTDLARLHHGLISSHPA